MTKSIIRIMAVLSIFCLSIAVFPTKTSALQKAQSDFVVTDENMKISSQGGNISYEEYLSSFNGKTVGDKSAKTIINKKVSKKPIEFETEIQSGGLYTLGMFYKAIGDETGSIEVSIEIDGKVPFNEAKNLLYPRMWMDEGEVRVDGLGNEFAAKQIPYDKSYYNEAADITQWIDDSYYVYLSKGVHSVKITPVTGEFILDYFEFHGSNETKNYVKPETNNEFFKGDSIIIEAENAKIKNSYWLAPKTDNTSVDITPNSTTKSLVNFIGGGNWKTSGDTIIWETPELSAGYYKLGFSFRQSTVLGGETYRSLTIDGVSPFAEAECIDFGYDYGWQTKFFEDKNSNPYLIYLSAGKHEIALTAVPGEMQIVRDLLRQAVAELSDLYIDITMITGESVDVYRDYELFTQIKDMEDRLNNLLTLLTGAESSLKEITGQESGSHSSVIKNMIRIINQMLENKFSAHRYVSEYYSSYTAVSAALFEMRDMPLDLDKIILASPDSQQVVEKVSLVERFIFSFKKFLVSYVQDYNNISGLSDSEQNVTIWVNWGRDQAQVLNALTQTFTAEKGIGVNVQLVNASIVQAVLSGNGPDCILQHNRSEPVNLAMRGVLYDLNQFNDIDDVLKRFKDGAEIPYMYKNGLYALPDTQIFYLMFYRKDILSELNIEIPKTWSEFAEVSKLLSSRNLSVWMQNNVATDITQTNAGIGSINLFPSLLLQNGLSIYQEDGKSTNLLEPKVMAVFNDWTDYYSKLKIPKTMDFYNRFRTGVTPLGITSYTMYTTLKVAAPEIDGMWGVSPIPGTAMEDGSISRLSSGGGTACAILKETENPQAAWEFLKWWTSTDTQFAYSNEVESILGAAGRVAVSNVEAFKSLQWDAEMKEPILEAWDNVREIPEYPGSYYVSRSVYHSFWNVVNENRNAKDMLLKYGKEANEEIARKWKQYENR